ncbi:MAG: hypothetical protein WCT08_04260 [Patescibacteria group bacterium]|jgi:hypothetical protein
MSKKTILIRSVFLIALAFVVTGCSKKTTNTNTTNTNTNVVVTEAPFVMNGSTKVFSLKLVNGLFNYKTMTFYAGDNVEVRLTSNNQPVDFKFQNVPATSTNGIFRTIIQDDDKGGTYLLVCSNQECGSITLTVIPKTNTNTTNGNTNQAANTNTSPNQITKVELQRIPAGTTFSPNNTYETTTSFNVGDQFGLSVTGEFKLGTTLAHTFTNSAGKEIEAQSKHQNLQPGTNGSCCFSLPTTAGSYNLKLYVDGKAAQSVPITLK